MLFMPNVLEGVPEFGNRSKIRHCIKISNMNKCGRCRNLDYLVLETLSSALRIREKVAFAVKKLVEDYFYSMNELEFHSPLFQKNCFCPSLCLETGTSLKITRFLVDHFLPIK